MASSDGYNASTSLRTFADLSSLLPPSVPGVLVAVLGVCLSSRSGVFSEMLFLLCIPEFHLSPKIKIHAASLNTLRNHTKYAFNTVLLLFLGFLVSKADVSHAEQLFVNFQVPIS